MMRARTHRLRVADDVDRQLQTDHPRHVLEQQRQHDDEGGAEEGSQDAAEPADDDHEQDLEGAVDVEGERLDAAGIDESPHRAATPQ